MKYIKVKISKILRLEHFRRGAVWLLAVSSLCAMGHYAMPHAYAVDAPVVCDSLTAQQSEDKNYYALNATVSAANGVTITGYKFDFGDHQSYTFSFDPASSQDRSAALVNHTYLKAGTFTATASVITTANGKKSYFTSPGCSTQIVIPVPSGNVLVNTGPGDILLAFFAANIIGAAAYRTVPIHRINCL